MENRTGKQIAASRANGAKSKGPVTPGGKARSSVNALKHGRYAITTPLLRGEDSEAFKEHLDAYITRFRPADLVELRLVRKVASADWRQARCAAIEARALDIAADQLNSPYLDSNGNSYPDSITLALRQDVDTSKLPTYLASREKDHDHTYDSGLRQLHTIRTRFPSVPSANRALNEEVDSDFDPLKQTGNEPAGR